MLLERNWVRYEYLADEDLIGRVRYNYDSMPTGEELSTHVVLAWRRSAPILSNMGDEMTDEEKMELYVKIFEHSKPFTITAIGCWEARFKPDSHGYVPVRIINVGTFKLHRVSYTVNVGPIPVGLWVLHKCDNKRCINPEHLYLGTAADNTRDSVERAWSGWPDQRGEHHAQAKLNWDKVRAIRASSLHYKELAKMYEVGPRQIHYVKSYQSWREEGGKLNEEGDRQLCHTDLSVVP